MASDRQLEEKGKVRPRPARQQQPPQRQPEPAERQTLSPADLRGRPDARALRRMQQTVGNGAVQRYLAQRRATGEGAVDEESAAAINRARGNGQPLDSRVAGEAGAVMGHSFDDVTVHADAEADRLSRNLGARAFTTGTDIFFREGAYAPGSREGQTLLAHELAHVVQQGGQSPTSQSQMTVNDPDDAYEAEADAVAEQVVNAEPAAGKVQAREELVQAQEEEEEELVQAQEMEEEEELMMQEEEEEEILA